MINRINNLNENNYKTTTTAKSTNRQHVAGKNRADRVGILAQAKETTTSQTMLIEMMNSSLAAMQADIKRIESEAEYNKILVECMKIAAKITDGTASMEEIRFLQKHGVEMYAMAMSLRKPKGDEDDNKENETTTDIKKLGENSPNTDNMMVAFSSLSAEE